jgi:hypothetical protein
MSRATLEVADIVRAAGNSFWEKHRSHLAWLHRKVLDAIVHCRTAALGGHLDKCVHCGHQAISFNSCRNRHCPKCQSLAKAQWLEQRQADLLPVPYFHVVFSVPAQIAALAYQNKNVVYGILFRAVAETLRRIAADPKHLGAQIGFLAVLHTWGQTLEHHPHIHCVVPGGGLTPDGKCWISCRPGFFLPVRVLSRLFRRLFLQNLDHAYQTGRLQFFTQLQPLKDPTEWSKYLAIARLHEWVVYAKRPFGGPEQVLDYLGRYTHRVAISNNRLKELKDGNISFAYKDYRHESRQKVMTLTADEFIRRFLLHVLPSGFQRLRQYGFLSGPSRTVKLARCRELLTGSATLESPVCPQDWRARYEAVTGESLDCCPVCHQGHMVMTDTLLPIHYGEQAKTAGSDSS